MTRITRPIGLLSFALTLLTSTGWADPPHASLPRLSGPIPTWWNGLAEHVEIPEYPAPFRHSTYRSKPENQPLFDLSNTQPISLPLIQYHAGTSPMSSTPHSLEVPAGTRWKRLSEGYGRSVSPEGGFLSVQYQLEPCPSSFPQTPGPARLDPKLAPTTVHFQISESQRGRCGMEVMIFAPRFRDEFSRTIAGSLVPVHRKAPPRDSDSTASTSDRLEPRESNPGSPLLESGSAGEPTRIRDAD